MYGSKLLLVSRFLKIGFFFLSGFLIYSIFSGTEWGTDEERFKVSLRYILKS